MSNTKHIKPLAGIERSAARLTGGLVNGSVGYCPHLRAGQSEPVFAFLGGRGGFLCKACMDAAIDAIAPEDGVNCDSCGRSYPVHELTARTIVHGARFMVFTCDNCAAAAEGIER